MISHSGPCKVTGQWDAGFCDQCIKDEVVWPVDLMKNDDGTFACAMWCEEGSVSVRGDVCRACLIDMASHHVINCAYAWYEARQTDEWELINITIRELEDAIEEREVVLSER